MTRLFLGLFALFLVTAAAGWWLGLPRRRLRILTHALHHATAELRSAVRRARSPQ
jgi:hypothetical protein